MSASFNTAVAKINGLKSSGKGKVTNDQKLALYGCFKQATVGANTTLKPGMFNVEAVAKWNAWSKMIGMSKADAEAGYIRLAAMIVA